MGYGDGRGQGLGFGCGCGRVDAFFSELNTTSSTSYLNSMHDSEGVCSRNRPAFLCATAVDLKHVNCSRTSVAPSGILLL